MGGAASALQDGAAEDIMTTVELTDKLSPNSQDLFIQYQDYCESCELTPMESYLFLSAKYEELLAADREAAVLEAEKNGQLAYLKDLTGTELFSEQRAKIEEDVLAHEITLALRETARNTQQNSKEVDIIGQVFKVDNQHGRLEFLDGIFGGSDEDENGEMEVDITNLQNARYVRKGTDGVECTLCFIDFEKMEHLTSHFKHSEMHRRNEKKRKKQVKEAHDEALRLAKLANTVIAQLNDAGTKQRRHQLLRSSIENVDALPRTSWHAAANKVILDRLTHQYAQRLERHVALPKRVKLLHSGSKYFHRTKVTYDIHIFLHQAADVLEIAAHVVPINHDSGEIIPSKDIIPCTQRIYANNTHMDHSMLGLARPDAKLTYESSEPSHSKKALLGRSFKAAEANALVVYIVSRLKVNPDKTVPPESALFFDQSGLQREVLLDETAGGSALPPSLVPVPIDVSTIHNIWRERCESTRAIELTPRPGGGTNWGSIGAGGRGSVPLLVPSTSSLESSAESEAASNVSTPPQPPPPADADDADDADDVADAAEEQVQQGQNEQQEPEQSIVPDSVDAVDGLEGAGTSGD